MALVGMALLWRYQSRQVAWLLARTVLVGSLAIIALKLLFLSCGFDWVSDLRSPSGHAGLSMIVYGTLAAILANGRRSWLQWVIWMVTVLIVLIIAVSRLTLRVHTAIEVVVGLAVGALALLWFVISLAKLPKFKVDPLRFGLGLGATLVLSFGVRLHAESLIRHLARHLAQSCSA